MFTAWYKINVLASVDCFTDTQNPWICCFTTIRIISFGINKVNKVYFDDYDHGVMCD